MCRKWAFCQLLVQEYHLKEAKFAKIPGFFIEYLYLCTPKIDYG